VRCITLLIDVGEAAHACGQVRAYAYACLCVSMCPCVSVYACMHASMRACVGVRMCASNSRPH